MLLKFKKALSKKNILDSVSEKVIYEYYLGETICENRKFNAPYRKDSDPSLTFKFFPGSQSWVWRDWGLATQNKPQSVFDFVAECYKCDFHSALLHINNDLNMGLSASYERSDASSPINDITMPVRAKVRSNKKIVVEYRNMEERDIRYWNSYGITEETLALYEVFAVDKVFIKQESEEHFKLHKKNNKSSKIYCYQINDHIKIYHPESSLRFLGNVSDKDYSGLKQLPDNGKLLIITKSHKDVMVLHEMQIPSISPQGESYTLDSEMMNDLYLRFDDIFILFDNDEAGVIGSNKAVEAYPFIKQIFIQKELSKDISDLAQKISLEGAYKYLKQILNDYT